jgi:hypothetical protein
MNPRHIAIFNTRDLKLASILTALGFEFESDQVPATRIRRESGDESTVFHFKAAHPQTSQQADEIMRAFSSDDYIEKNPEAPVAYMIAALRNRDQLLTAIKATPRQIVFERNGKIVSISENATDEDKKRFAKFI